MGRLLPLGGPRQRAVLAHLLVHANGVVPADVLIDDVWDDEPPEGARSSLQSYVSRLRGAVGAERIEGRAGGYVLRIDDEEVDAFRFEAAVRRARQNFGRDPGRASDELGDALALWRGSAFADLASFRSLQGEIQRLEELRVGAIEDRNEADLAMGRHAQLVSELDRLVARHPLRERLRAQHMLALYRSGRQAEALASYNHIRNVLAEELGIDPGLELQELMAAVLRQDPSLVVSVPHLAQHDARERIPETRYARSGDVSIAYQVFGEGPVDLVWVPGYVSNVEYVWQ